MGNNLLDNNLFNHKFFNFIKPFTSYIDKGKLFRQPFQWLYIAISVLNLVIPLYMLYIVIDAGIFRYGGAKDIFSFLFVWLFIVLASWVGFQIWWDRKDKVLKTTEEGSEFPVTPVFSHLIQTLGEWVGTWIAIVGFGFSLFATLFLGEYGARGLGHELGLPVGTGFWGIILMPIWGFLIIVFSRLIAEGIRALVAIANNTKK